MGEGEGTGGVTTGNRKGEGIGGVVAVTAGGNKVVGGIVTGVHQDILSTHMTTINVINVLSALFLYGLHTEGQ